MSLSHHNRSNTIAAWAAALTALSVTVIVGSKWFLQRLKIRAPPRPELSLLERWYASAPKRRRVVAVIPDWSLDLESTRYLLAAKRNQILLLRCRIENGKWVEMTETSDVPLEFIQDSSSWERTAERLLSENMTDRTQLWRVALSEEKRYLVVMLDHVLADGLGLAGFVNELFETVASLADQRLPPMLEEHIEISPSIGRVLGALLNSKDVGFVGPLTKSDQGIDKTVLRSAVFRGDTVSRLRSLCREKSTTMHALLCSCAALTLQKMVKKSGLHVKILTPISLRSRVSDAMGRPFGNYVAPTNALVNLSISSNVWLVAQGMKQQIDRDAESAERELGLLTFVTDFEEFQGRTEQNNPLGRVAAIEVSNLGVCATKRNWYFAQGNHYAGPLLAVNLVTNQGSGQMFLTVTSRSLAVDSNSLDEFTEGLVDMLENSFDSQ